MMSQDCPISHEVEVTRQWKLVSSWNITREIFFFKIHAENEVGRLVTNLFLKKKKASNEVK